jgi:Rad3-related DNA helicase
VLIASKRTNPDGDSRASYVPVPNKEQLLNIAGSSTNIQAYSEANSYMLATSALTSDEWQLLPESYISILVNMRQGADSLNQWLHGSALFGLKTGLNDAFVIDENTRNELIETDTASDEVIKPVLFGRDVRRYFVAFHDRYVIYLHPDRNVEDYPAIKKHLAKYRDALEKRAASQEWFELQQPATSLIEHNREAKIVYPIIANECRFALDDDGYFINDKLFTLPSNDLSLLGVLNSRLANFYFGCVCAALEGSGDRYLEFRAQYVDEFPVSNVFSNWHQRSKLTSLGERMLDLHERLAGARLERERTVIGHQISATDRQIDQLVYELYSLTDEEIQIVEEATAR